MSPAQFRAVDKAIVFHPHLYMMQQEFKTKNKIKMDSVEATDEVVGYTRWSKTARPVPG